MMGVSVSSRDAPWVAADLRAVGVRSATRSVAVVHQYGRVLHSRVRANASSRPGPRRITGRYWNSIKLRYQLRGVMTVAEVYTNDPRSRRLEQGFTGTDSLGRTFNQRPYPHFGPASDRTGPEFVAALALAIP